MRKALKHLSVPEIENIEQAKELKKHKKVPTTLSNIISDKANDNKEFELYRTTLSKVKAIPNDKGLELSDLSLMNPEMDNDSESNEEISKNEESEERDKEREEEERLMEEQRQLEKEINDEIMKSEESGDNDYEINECFNKLKIQEICTALAAMLTIVASLIYHDFNNSVNKDGDKSKIVINGSLIISSLSVLFFIYSSLNRYLVILKLSKASSIVNRNTSFWNKEYWIPFTLESLFALIHPNIFTKGHYFTTPASEFMLSITYEVNDFIVFIVLFRIYVIYRFIISISIFYSSRSSRIAQLIGAKLTRSFAIKCIVQENPFFFLISFSCLSILMLSFMLKVVEGPAYTDERPSNDFRSIENCLWNILVTMTTVGYGDMFPITNLGRIINIFASIVGAFFVALLTLSLQNALAFTSFEEQAYFLRKKLLMENELELRAGRLFKTSFQYCIARKKYRNAVDSGEVDKAKKEMMWKKMENSLFEKIEMGREFKKTVQFYRNNYEPLTEPAILDNKMDGIREGLVEMNETNKDIKKTINETQNIIQECIIRARERKLKKTQNTDSNN